MHRFDDSRRLRLITVLPDGEPIASVSGVWQTANWMEREAYDMFGVGVRRATPTSSGS